MLGMGDIGGLFGLVKESGMLDKQPEMMEKFKKGQFSLRDMYIGSECSCGEHRLYYVYASWPRQRDAGR